MNFRKISERGGGVIFDPKNFIAIFFTSKTAILVMIFRKNFQKGGGHFRSKKICCKFCAVWSGFRKNRNIFSRDGRMETSGMPNVPQTYPRTMIPVLRKLHTKWKGGRVGTSNFRRLMSCWINWYPVDPSQLVPSLLPLLLGNLIFPRRLRLWGNTDFRCGAPGFYPGKTNLCLWRADGDIRRLPHAA